MLTAPPSNVKDATGPAEYVVSEPCVLISYVPAAAVAKKELLLGATQDQQARAASTPPR